MKILLTFEHGLNGEVIGGGQRILASIIQEFKKTNDVTVILLDNHSNEYLESIYPGVKFITKKTSPNVLIRLFRLSLECVSKIVLNKYDLVISFTSENIFVAPACRLFNINHISYLAAPDLDGFSNKFSIKHLITIRKRFDLYLFILGMKFSSQNYAIGTRIKNQLGKVFNIQNCKVLYPGVDKILRERNFKKLESKKINVVYLGRIEFKQKPLDILLKCIALNKHRINKCLIIGSGPDIDNAISLCQYLNIDKIVDFKGSLDLKMISENLIDIDIAILPSSNESFMLTAYELLYSRIPIIVNDVADIKKTLDWSEMVQIVNLNEEDFNIAINNYFLNPPTLDDAEKIVYYIDENFNWSKMTNQIICNLTLR